ncbi:MAG: hypothetical protein ABIO21_08050 [Pseudomonas sp.]
MYGCTAALDQKPGLISRFFFGWLFMVHKNSSSLVVQDEIDLDDLIRLAVIYRPGKSAAQAGMGYRADLETDLYSWRKNCVFT